MRKVEKEVIDAIRRTIDEDKAWIAEHEDDEVFALLVARKHEDVRKSKALLDEKEWEAFEGKLARSEHRHNRKLLMAKYAALAALQKNPAPL